LTGRAPKGRGFTTWGVIFILCGWLQIHLNSAKADGLVADFSDVAWLA